LVYEQDLGDVSVWMQSRIWTQHLTHIRLEGLGVLQPAMSSDTSVSKDGLNSLCRGEQTWLTSPHLTPAR